MKRLLFLTFLLTLILGITTALFVSSDIAKKEQMVLLENYDQYVIEKQMESIEIHHQRDFIFSLYQKTENNNIGIVEYFPERQTKVEVENNPELVFISMKGKAHNYIGLKFNQYAEDIGSFKIKFQNNDITFEVNGENEDGFTDTYLTIVEFDPDKIEEITLFDKNHQKLNTISR